MVLCSVVCPQDPDPSTGVVGEASREVQIVATRADYGQVIGAGWFRLALNYGNITELNPEVKSRTDLIPYNATEAQMQAALQALANIDIVEVRRYGPTPQNTYQWKITLDWRIPIGIGAGGANNTPPIGVTGTGAGVGSFGAWNPSGFGTVGSSIRGKLPLLVAASEELFDVTWQGGYHTVWVREARAGSTGPELCSVTCSHVVNNLKPGTQYQFRVRALNGEGWSEWSGISEAVGTLPMTVPVTPNSPVFLSATSSSITLMLVRGEGLGLACVVIV